MALSYSQGFLNQFGNLANQSVLREGANAEQPMFGSNNVVARQLASGIGGATGTGFNLDTPDMVARQRIAELPDDNMKAENSILINAQLAQDPQVQSALLMKHAELKQARERSTAAQLQQQAVRSSLIARAQSAGLTGVAETLKQGGSIEEAQKELRDLEIKGLTRNQNKPALASLGQSLGLKGTSLRDFVNADPDVRENIAKGLEGDVKPFQSADTGEVSMIRENKSGMLFMDGRWADPSELGLTQAPAAVQRIMNQGDKIMDKLTDSAFERFGELNQAARDAAKTIDNVERGLGFVNSDEIYTGALANGRLNLDRLAATAADMLGQEYDNSSIANTELFFQSRLQEMALYVKQLGSGTGISDKDVAIALGAVGAEITLDETTIKGIMTAYAKVSRKTIDDYNTARELLINEGADPRGVALNILNIGTQPSTRRTAADYLAEPL
jgi:hypothetical protein